MTGIGRGRGHRCDPGIYDQREYVSVGFKYDRTNGIATSAVQNYLEKYVNMWLNLPTADSIHMGYSLLKGPTLSEKQISS